MAPIRGLLFDKDGTLLDFHATWAPILERLTAELAAGDAALAKRLLEHGGRDPLSGRYRAGSLLAQGNTVEIAQAWHPNRGVAARLLWRYYGVVRKRADPVSVA